MRASNGVRWSALAVVVLALAGCSNSPPPGDDAAPAAPLDALGQGLANGTATNATWPLTDMLFLSSPTRLNASGLPDVTVLATLSGAAPQAYSWNATLNGTGNLSHARLLLWIDLQSSAIQPGVGGDPACTASLTLVVTRNGTALAQAGGCASAGVGTVPPGEHLLDFGTPLTAFPGGLLLGPQDKVLVQVAFGLSFPQGVGYVLGGGDRASGLRLAGLAEPVPP
jgi:hypothetical protein